LVTAGFKLRGDFVSLSSPRGGLTFHDDSSSYFLLPETSSSDRSTSDMAPPASESKPAYQKDEKVYCFHGALLYEAKLLDTRRQNAQDKSSPFEYRVHYKGWKNT
jgi:hypothetical protein